MPVLSVLPPATDLGSEWTRRDTVVMDPLGPREWFDPRLPETLRETVRARGAGDTGARAYVTYLASGSMLDVSVERHRGPDDAARHWRTLLDHPLDPSLSDGAAPRRHRELIEGVEALVFKQSARTVYLRAGSFLLSISCLPSTREQPIPDSLRRLARHLRETLQIPALEALPVEVEVVRLADGREFRLQTPTPHQVSVVWSSTDPERGVASFEFANRDRLPVRVAEVWVESAEEGLQGTSAWQTRSRDSSPAVVGPGQQRTLEVPVPAARVWRVSVLYLVDTPPGAGEETDGAWTGFRVASRDAGASRD